MTSGVGSWSAGVVPLPLIVAIVTATALYGSVVAGIARQWLEDSDSAYGLLLVGAALFVLRPAWPRPLALAVAAVATLFILTFVQPPLWIRFILDTLLVCGVWWAYRRNRPYRLAKSGVPAASPT